MSEEISSRAAEVGLVLAPSGGADSIPSWQHDALLRSIEAVDYAPPTLAQVKAQQARTQTQLDGDIKRLKALEAATYVSSFPFPRFRS